jgi:hypothetical protein
VEIASEEIASVIVTTIFVWVAARSVVMVEGYRRECATFAAASAVSSRLLLVLVLVLSGREQVRDNELGWISASQAGVSMHHRIVFSRARIRAISGHWQKPT